VEAKSLQRKQTRFTHHVQAGMLFYGKAGPAKPVYAWMARMQFDRACRAEPRAADEIADFFRARGQWRQATHFRKACLKDPSCRRDADAWKRLGDAYCDEAAAAVSGSRRSVRCDQAAKDAAAQAARLALPAPSAAAPRPVTQRQAARPASPGTPPSEA
jgi:hypothetical protein